MMSSWKIGISAAVALLLTLSANATWSQNYEEVIHYHNDALGSPVAATDGNGDLLWSEEYAPYGSRLLYESREVDPQTGAQVESSWDEKQWFTGKLEETRTGLQYYGARWYEPEIGRFLSVDPVEFQPDNIFSFNRYAYANNNPYKYVDPDGRNAILAIALVTLAVVDFSLSVGHENEPGDDSIRPVAPDLGLGAGGSLVKAGKKGGDLFRVVDDVELTDIQNTGAFRTSPGSFEGKQFVDNLDDAKALQKKFSDFFGGNQSIVRGQAPKSVLDNASRTPFSDIPNGTAITVPKTDLPAIKPKL